YQWKPPFAAIAGETYLGRPFAAPPPPALLEETRREVDAIHHQFLQNLARQTPSGFRLCLALPAWQSGRQATWRTKSGFLHLQTLDSLEKLGYTRMSFVHAPQERLVYHRPRQIVGRELVVLTRVYL